MGIYAHRAYGLGATPSRAFVTQAEVKQLAELDITSHLPTRKPV